MELSLKVAAVGGISMIWYYFTKEAFNFSWHIITTSPEKDTYRPVERAMCTECRHFFPGDETDEPFVCFSCSGGPNMILKKNLQYTMSDNKLVKTILDAATLTGIAAGIGWIAKKVAKENFTPDPSNVMSYVKFTAVMVGSIALKKYLEDQKILLDSV